MLSRGFESAKGWSAVNFRSCPSRRNSGWKKIPEIRNVSRIDRLFFAGLHFVQAYLDGALPATDDEAVERSARVGLRRGVVRAVRDPYVNGDRFARRVLDLEAKRLPRAPVRNGNVRGSETRALVPFPRQRLEDSGCGRSDIAVSRRECSGREEGRHAAFVLRLWPEQDREPRKEQSK